MSDAPTDPYGFCETVVREADRDAWLSALFAPAALRPHLHALDAFRIELGHVRGRVRQPMAGEIRLQWWRDAVFGEAGGDVSANPLAAALIHTIERHDLPRGLLDDAIEAHRIALYGEPVRTLATLEQRVEQTFGGFLRIAARVLAGAEADMEQPAQAAGSALGLTATLRDFAHDAPRGWSAVPTEILERHGAGPGDPSAGAATPALGAALAELRTLARARLATFRADQTKVPDAAAPAYLRLALVEPTLRLLDRSAADPFAFPPELPQWRRQWSLWRAARRGRV